MSEKNNSSCAGIQDEQPNHQPTSTETPVANTASEATSRGDILDPFRNLAKRWREESVRHKRIYDQCRKDRVEGGILVPAAAPSFQSHVWMRYVDYERRASELELRIGLTEKVFCNGNAD